MPKTLMLFDKQQKSMGGEKLGGRLKGNQVELLWGCITSPIEAKWKMKWLKVRWMVKVEPMMWMSSIREEKIKEGKTFTKHRNAWKWAIAKIGPASGLPGHVLSKEWMTNKSPKRNGGWRKEELARHKKIEQNGKVETIAFYYAKFQKMAFRDGVEGICNIHII